MSADNYILVRARHAELTARLDEFESRRHIVDDPEAFRQARQYLDLAQKCDEGNTWGNVAIERSLDEAEKHINRIAGLDRLSKDLGRALGL